jgi:ribose transport system permease protein
MLDRSQKAMKSLPRPAELVERYALLMLLAIVFVFFAVNPSTPEFASTLNIQNILSNESLLGIIAIATVIPLVANQIDLSAGPVAGLGSLLCAGMMSKSGWPLAPSILVAVGVGFVVGLVNGILVAKVGINSIVTTLGTSSIVGAIIVWYSKGVSISTGLSSTLLSVGVGDWLGVRRLFFFLVAIALIAWYVLEHTPVGRHLYSVGASPRAAELVGLSVPKLIIGSFVASGVIAGAAGVLAVAVQGAANPQIGSNFTLPAVAAAFLGATAIKPGRYNIWGTFTAVFFLAFAVNGLTLWGAEAWISDLFNGTALILAVGIGAVSGRRRRTRPAAAAPPDAAEPLDASLPQLISAAAPGAAAGAERS